MPISADVHTAAAGAELVVGVDVEVAGGVAPKRGEDHDGDDRDGPAAVPGEDGLQAETTQMSEATKIVITQNGLKLTWKEVGAGLRREPPALRNLLSLVLRQMPFESLKWECVPLSRASMGCQPFECVVFDYPGLLAKEADPTDFAEHLAFVQGQEVAVDFPNINGSCSLVSPAQATKEWTGVYGHLASFLRGAPSAQVDAQWRQLGEAIHQRLLHSSTSLWVSTAGGAVPWLHMRVDSAPKYYQHTAYCEPAPAPLAEAAICEHPSAAQGGDAASETSLPGS